MVDEAVTGDGCAIGAVDVEVERNASLIRDGAVDEDRDWYGTATASGAITVTAWLTRTGSSPGAPSSASITDGRASQTSGNVSATAVGGRVSSSDTALAKASAASRSITTGKGASSGDITGQTLPRISAALMPPKAKELLMAIRIGTDRAVFGTQSIGQRGSGTS